MSAETRKTPILECSECNNLFEGVLAYSEHLILEKTRNNGIKRTGCSVLKPALKSAAVEVYKLK